MFEKEKASDFYVKALKVSRAIVDAEYPNLKDEDRITHVIKLMDVIMAVELRKNEGKRVDAMTGMLEGLIGKIG